MRPEDVAVAEQAAGPSSAEDMVSKWRRASFRWKRKINLEGKPVQLKCNGVGHIFSTTSKVLSWAIWDTDGGGAKGKTKLDKRGVM